MIVRSSDFSSHNKEKTKGGMGTKTLVVILATCVIAAAKRCQMAQVVATGDKTVDYKSKYFKLYKVIPVLVCVHLLSPPRPKREVAFSKQDFYKLALDNDEICTEDGCFAVRDALRNPFYKIPMERQLYQTKSYQVKAVATLKIPKEKTISNMDSRSWDVIREYLSEEGLEYVMASLLPNRSTIVKVLIVGIGSGALANYIQHTYPWSFTTMVERREKMARFLLEWFQIYPMSRLKIYAEDPIKFVHNLAEKGTFVINLMTNGVDATVMIKINNNIVNNKTTNQKPYK
ncbi:hypothetical protein ANCCEY_12301 [Ancylostoma ceylanicum]|uniref:Uncharacterized protein n=1 Tax=Ancylostoma ceylanicum TaxID=53326 RepID=A0A0D6L9I6_9BILA|nr:hypothetical protein ANCCEY_12301 [Ancylostoma ceylanicum]